MRVLGWITGGLLALVVLAVVAAWLVPPMLDWARYRDEIASLASRQVGRPVRIEGPVTLALLPEPILTASGVQVDDPGDGSRLAVASLRVRVALGALFAGRVEARELVMRGLDVRLPWPLGATPARMRAPTWLADVSARVERSRVSVGDLVLSDIDATLSTDPLTGTYQAAGTATLSGRGWHFTARMSQPGSDGSASLDLALDGRGLVQGVGVTLSCQIGADGSLGGQLSARGPDLAQLLPAPHVPFRTQGRITIAGGLAAADDLTVDIGGSPGRGAVAFRLSPLPRLDVALATSRLNLDAWLPTLTHVGSPVVSLGVDLSAEAADLAGGEVRRLRGAFDFSDGVTDVRELQAVLPGEAELDLAGRLENREFAGDVRLTAPALRTTFAWLQNAGFGPLSSLPDGVFRTAELSGHARIGGGQIAIADLDGRIDDMHVVGSAAARVGARLAISAGLRMERLDLDPWLPSALPAPSALSAKLRPFDIDLRLHVEHALAHGLDLAPLALDAAADDGRVQLRRLDLATRDVQVSASGSMTDGRLADARLDLRAARAEPLLSLLPPAMALAPDRVPVLFRSPLRLQAAAGGPPEQLGLQLRADLGDLRIETQPTIDLTSGRWTGPLTIRHPGAPRLAEAVGLKGAPAWLGDGSFALIATLAATPGRLTASDLDLTAGTLHATGQLALENGGAAPRLTGRLAAETLPLPMPYLRSPDPLPLGVLTGWGSDVALRADHVLLAGSPFLDKAVATLALADGRLEITGLTAQLGGGSASAYAAVDTSASPPVLTLRAQVSGASISGPLLDLPIDIASGTVDGNVALRAAGFSARTLLATLDGSLALHFLNGTITGLSLPPAQEILSDRAVAASFSAGTTAFDDFDVQAALGRGGILLRSATLASPLGTVRITGALDPVAETAELQLTDRPFVPDPPEIGLRLTGPLDGLQRTPELARLAQWRASHATAAVP